MRFADSRPLRLLLFCAASCLLIGGCSSGGGGAECSLDGGTTLADTDWPMFRRDQANRGRARPEVSLVGPRIARRVFPRVGAAKIGPIAAAPILGRDGVIFVASQDGTVYLIDAEGNPVLMDQQEPPQAIHLEQAAPISATPLLGADETLFVAAGDGTLTQYNLSESGTSEVVIVRSSTAVGGFISGSPNIGADGTIYLGTQAGTFTGVCPNGVSRFFAALNSVRSTVAVTNDPDDSEDRIVIVAEESGQIRAFDILGRQRWSFFASTGVRGAVVLDDPERPERFFVADGAGRLFAGNVVDGKRTGVCSTGDAEECTSSEDCTTGECVPFAFRTARCSADTSRPCITDQDCGAAAPCLGEEVTASPALGMDTLYVVSEAGVLYAVDSRSGAFLWLTAVDARVLSSPAVAVGGPRETVVFGADGGCLDRGGDGVGCPNDVAQGDGCLYAVEDGEIIWCAPLDAAVGTSSASIDGSGTVYIGTEGGILYAIETPNGTPTSSPTPTPTAAP